MNIIARNFFRLLRAGAFGSNENVEPMSAWKWKQVYRVAVDQRVAPLLYRGIERLQGQFFLQIPDAQLDKWRQEADASSEAGEAAQQLRLTNRLNDRRLNKIISTAASTSPTLEVLKALLRATRHMMDDGRYLQPVVEAAYLLRDEKSRIDNEQLAAWSDELHMTHIAQLEAALMHRLLGLPAELMPFAMLDDEKAVEVMTDDIFSNKHPQSGNLHFSQGNDIFVHTSNSKAMLWQAKRSARYFRYYPSESITNLFSAFAKSLTDIEE